MQILFKANCNCSLGICRCETHVVYGAQQSINILDCFANSARNDETVQIGRAGTAKLTRVVRFLLVFILLVASVSSLANPNSFDLLNNPKPETKNTGDTKAKPEKDKGIVSDLLGGDSSNKEQAKTENKTDPLFESSSYQDFVELPSEEDLFDKSYLAGNPDASAKLSTSDENKKIDPNVVTKIQSVFLDKLYPAFSKIAGYAVKLLYLFAVLELAMFGMIWALQRDIAWEKLIFKIIKIGLIFFIIQNYPYLVETIMHSFIKLAGVIVNDAEAAQYIFNPAKLWQYGYDFGVNLLHSATNAGSNFGLAMIYILLGIGILLVFGLLGIQMVVQMLSFYLVALGSLIFLPFGAFSLGRNMFDKAVQAVFQAGIRLMGLITVIGLAMIIWDSFGLIDIQDNQNPNINQCLGLFFSALLFLCLAFYLPKILSQVVGSFRQDFDNSSPAAAGAQAGFAATSVDIGGSSDMQAATVIDASSSLGYGGRDSGSSSSSSPVSVSVSPSGSVNSKLTKETMDQASNLAKSISESTVKKIKEAVVQANKSKG